MAKATRSAPPNKPTLTLLDTIIVFLSGATLLLFLFWFAGVISGQPVFESIPGYWGTIGDRIWAWITGGAVGSVLLVILRRQYTRELPSPPYGWYILGVTVALWIAVMLASVTLQRFRKPSNGVVATDTALRPQMIQQDSGPLHNSEPGSHLPAPDSEISRPVATASGVPDRDPGHHQDLQPGVREGRLGPVTLTIGDCEQQDSGYLACHVRLTNSHSQEVKIEITSALVYDNSGAEHNADEISIIGSAADGTKTLPPGVATNGAMSFVAVPRVIGTAQMLRLGVVIDGVSSSLVFRSIRVKEWGMNFLPEMPG